MTDRIILREDDHSGGTTETVPLSDEARKYLARGARLAGIFLFLIIVGLAGSIVGLVLAGPATLATLVIPAFLFLFYYDVGIVPRTAMRNGQMRRYEGWWEERVVWQQTDVYAVEIKLPDLPRVMKFSNRIVVQTAARAGASEEWGPCQGVVEYTVAKHIPLAYRPRHEAS